MDDGTRKKPTPALLEDQVTLVQKKVVRALLTQNFNGNYSTILAANHLDWGDFRKWFEDPGFLMYWRKQCDATSEAMEPLALMSMRKNLADSKDARFLRTWLEMREKLKTGPFISVQLGDIYDFSGVGTDDLRAECGSLDRTIEALRRGAVGDEAESDSD